MMSPLVTIALKATLVLVVPCVLALLVRRSSSGARHLAWSWSLRAALVLPVAALVLPRWSPLPVTHPRPSATPTAGVATEVPLDRVGDVPSSPSTAPARAPASQASPIAARPQLVSMLLAAWALGIAAGLGSLLIQATRLRRLVSRCRQLSDGGWERDAARCAGTLGIERTVRLLISDDVAAPFTMGGGQPVIVLPSDAAEWPAARRRMVLLHELAHAARGDARDVILARLAVIAWWPHPLAWLAHRRCRLERERACDDRVIEAGSRPSEYAGELLALVDRARGPALVPAVAGDIEARVRSILDARQTRRPPSRRVAMLSGALAAACTLALASWGVAAVRGSSPALVLHLRSGMMADLDKVMEARFPARREGDAVIWERQLRDVGQRWQRGTGPALSIVNSREWWSSFPASLHLRFTLSRDGDLSVAASGPVSDVLAVLGDGGMVSSTTWGHPATGPAVTPLLTADARSTALAYAAGGELLDLARGGAIDAGDRLATATVDESMGSVLMGIETMPIEIENRLGAPITVAVAAIYVAQPSTKFAYGSVVDGRSYTESPAWTMMQAQNAAWDPLREPDTDGPRARHVDFAWTGVQASHVTALAQGDNSNSGSVSLDGKAVTGFHSWTESANAVRLPDARPSSADLALDVKWSSSTVAVRAVALGGSMKATLADGDPASVLTWSIPAN